MQLIEVIAETDDVLLEKFLEGETPTVEELKAGIRQATIDLKVFPVLCGSAFKNKGVQTLLDAVVDYLPSPLDKPPVEGIDPSHHDKNVIRKPEDAEPLSALVFKIINDPFGKLCFIRLYSGSLKTGDTILNPRTGKTDRVGRLVKMHANKREDITEIYAGDICACVGLKDLKTGDTLSAPHHPIALGAITFPETVISVAIEPKTKADQEKMGIALARLADEDPTFKVRTDEDSGQTIISGMGELHLEILVDRMRREHKVEANVGEPKVAFRETIRKKAEAEGKYIRQTGGSGNYGHCWLRIEPNEPGKGYEFVNDIKGGVVPKEYIKPIDQGVQGALELGILAGYPIVDVKVTLVRRQLPRCRLERNGLQVRRFHRVQGSRKKSISGSAGAGDGGRSDGSRGVHGNDYRRHQLASRAHRGHGAPGRFAGHQGDRAAEGNVWLRERHSFVHAGQGFVLDAVRAIRRSSAHDRRRNHRPGAGEVKRSSFSDQFSVRRCDRGASTQLRRAR